MGKHFRGAWASGFVALFIIAFAVGCAAPQGAQQGAPSLVGQAAPVAVVGQGGIAGKVVDGKTGAPLDKATITTTPKSAGATTDAAGQYKIDGVPWGVYYVVVTRAGYNASDGQVSVPSERTETLNFSLVQADPFALARVKGVAWRTGDTDAYPDGALRLTTHYALAGDLSHSENIIITNGLPNVAVGSYVYLEGKALDGAGKEVTSWQWQVIGPHEVAIGIENADSQTPRFIAGGPGKYTATVTVTNVDGKKSSSSLDVYAGTYVGEATCATCHSGSIKEDKVTEWQETGHATKLIDTFDSYTPERDYCIACHTTGYNELDKGQGFDDLARQAGWNPAKGSLTGWLIQNKWTVDQIMASPMGKLANVQCEACHGPGSVHAGIVEAVKTAQIFEPATCSQCHPQEAEWRNSGHAKTGYNNMEQAGSADCVQCHTGQGYVEVKIGGNEPIFPASATSQKPATLAAPSEQPPIACAACHDPHAFTEPFQGASGLASRQLRVWGDVMTPQGVMVNAEVSATCVECHANRRDLQYKAQYIAGQKARSTHGNTQADVFYGFGAIDWGQKFGTSAHQKVVTESCVQCHMATNPTVGAAKAVTVGGHSFNTAGTWEGQPIENLGACTNCHKGLTTFNRTAKADFDADGAVEGVQDEIKGLLALVAAQLPKDPQTKAVLSSGITTANTTQLQREALWNYQ
ncbi:MAG: carboxypeptidase regulatory-like domain-containing protein, partial [Chloroflexi bacterium]|nr:carboxypeptidase regulatory-like domain-containing protein [Chloroflexota bacterium]